MKPDPEIYYLAAAGVRAKPEEIVFVDDFIENIEGATRVGMRTIHFQDPVNAQLQLAQITGVAAQP
jgi:FMN phosphatase YigB (HAD superfamily)